MTETAVAVINASAIRHNLEQIKSAAAGCRIMAVIKANAYGHGLIQVARILSDVDALAVARVEEGASLRAAGIGQPILVLEGCADFAEAELAAEHNLDLVVHEPSHFEMLDALPTEQSVGAWLKLDTGMGRLGFDAESLDACLKRIKACAAVKPDVRVMTHLACADDPNDRTTLEQVRSFGAALGNFTGDVSIANSAGVLLWPQTLTPSAMFDYKGENWVRPGMALYGASPVPGRSARDFGLEPAMSFESRLIAIRTLLKGARVGYGATWQADRETVVGVVAVGYGDGYPRHLETGTPVVVNGHRVRLVGRVSMDMITVDLTDVPAADVGDRVVLWGSNPGVEEIAARAGTISYEVMCGLSQRTKHRIVEDKKSRSRSAGISRGKTPS